MAALYHHTDTARLPWILRSGELRAGRNAIGGFPDPDFLWVTGRPEGDRTSSASRGKALSCGYVRLVRFTLPADEFEPWRDVMARYPQWTSEQIQRLIDVARQKGLSAADINSWQTRLDPLPRPKWIAIETRSWTDKRWKPLSVDTKPFELAPDILGLEVDGRPFIYREFDTYHGAQGYQPIPEHEVLLGSSAFTTSAWSPN